MAELTCPTSQRHHKHNLHTSTGLGGAVQCEGMLTSGLMSAACQDSGGIFLPRGSLHGLALLGVQPPGGCRCCMRSLHPATHATNLGEDIKQCPQGL